MNRSNKGNKKYTTEDFIKIAKEIHKNKYLYDKTVYLGSKEKVIITCPIHGDFLIRANNHLNGVGCHKCSKKHADKEHTLTTEQFIEKAKLIHGDKYDYSKVEYVNNHTKVCIICPEHGEFWQKPSNHLLKNGCKECSKLKISKEKTLTTEQFIEKAKKIHGDKYDYSKVNYERSFKKVSIICPKHGEFLQSANGHIYNKEGCPECAKELNGILKKGTKDWFISKSEKKHGKKYIYSNVNYIGEYNKVEIICPKHGIFLQTPKNHMNGCGCPSCNNSKLENEVSNILNEYGIKYNREQKFKWLLNLRLDFYLPDYNIAIECQGIQHFEPIKIKGETIEYSIQKFKKQKERDILKNKKCKENNVKLFYINYNENVKFKIDIILKSLNII